MAVNDYDAMPLKSAALPPVDLDLTKYVFQPKHNGHRWLVESNPHTEPPMVTVRTRQHNQPTVDRSEITGQVPLAFPEHHVVLDGELVAYNSAGAESLGDLRKGARRLSADGSTLILFLFDVVEVEKKPVIDEPYSERLERLKIMHQKGATAVIQLSPTFYPQTFEDPKIRLQKLVETLLKLQKNNAEGVVAKKLDAPYNAHKPRLRTDAQIKYRFLD